MRRCAQCMFVDGISANSNPISTRAKMHVVACNWGVPSMSYLGISLSQALASGKTCEKAISGVCGFKLTVHFPERGRPPPLVGELKAAGCVERCKVRHVLPFHLVQEGTPMSCWNHCTQQVPRFLPRKTNNVIKCRKICGYL